MTTHPCNGWGGALSGFCALTAELITEPTALLGNVILDAVAGLSRACTLTAELTALWGEDVLALALAAATAAADTAAADAAGGLSHTFAVSAEFIALWGNAVLDSAAGIPHTKFMTPFFESK
mmetsp:Transcript_112849/g.224546  ORF Transcript_112849/g.224546 Transcript_112849/m.224546 type:complete len:122 (-) Transcript_112849:643-1008(-)